MKFTYCWDQDREPVLLKKKQEKGNALWKPCTKTRSSDIERCLQKTQLDASISKLTCSNPHLFLQMQRGKMYSKKYINQSVTKLFLTWVSSRERGPWFIHFSSVWICFILFYNEHGLLNNNKRKRSRKVSHYSSSYGLCSQHLAHPLRTLQVLGLNLPIPQPPSPASCFALLCADPLHLDSLPFVSHHAHFSIP